MPIVIQLNYPALERMLGGDTELEIKLRHQIVEEFIKKRLKGLVNNQALQAVEKQVKDEAFKEAEELVGKIIQEKTYFNTKYSVLLTNHVKSLIKSTVETTVREATERYTKQFNDNIADTVERLKRHFFSYVTERVQKSLDEEIDKQVQAEIQRRLSTAAAMKPEAK